MGTSAGPNIVRDGLVFGYDTGYPAADNTQALTFNNGEPTTNLITNPLADSITGFNRSGGTGTISYDSTEKALKWVQTDYASWGTYLNIYPSFTGTLSTSAQYTFSCEYKTQNAFADSNISHQLVQGNGQSSATTNSDISSDTYAEINGWKQYRVTFTPSNTGVSTAYNRFITGDRGSDTLTMYIKNIQFEQKSHQTPFVNGTRSSTQSVIDLKESTNIDVSNASFDSNAQMIFDGTDDVISTSHYSGRNPSNSPFSVEAIVKSTTTSGNRMWLDVNGNGSNQRFYCAHASDGSSTPMGIQNSGWSHSIPQDTNYHHYVITMDGSTATLYNNGTSHSSKSYTSYTLPNNIQAGGRSGYRWVGYIPIFKIYEKVLTTDEIALNYNAYKKRFGI